MVKFLRRDSKRYAKLGKKRRKKQIWKKPKGRDNKIRKKRKGYTSPVSIGYGSNRKLREKIEEKKPILVNNLEDLERISKENIIILGKIGKRRKIELIKKAEEKKIPIFKINKNKFLKKFEKKKIKKTEEKVSKNKK